MSTPIIILNRDRLQYTKNLVNHLHKLGYANITILDLGSSYQPLLDWYKTLSVNIIMADNCGHQGLWTAGYIDRWRDYPWIAVTDSDVSLHPDTPRGFIEQMITVAKDYRVDKVGLAIEYRDISNEYLRKIIYPIESNYWKQQLVHATHEVYNAPTDTTFCIVIPDLSFQYEGVRLADWPIRHLDWYTDWSNMTDEEQYYMDKADASIATIKQHYSKWRSLLL